jgi:type II secretory pathway pseudopilin PulG
MSGNAYSRAGLSLLELLVSLALLALIGAGLAGSFGLGTQIWNRSASLSEHQLELALRTQLRRYMTQALPPTRLTPFRQPFTGGREGLSFITLAETPFAPKAAAMRMTLSVVGDQLLLRTELLDDAGDNYSTWQDTLVSSVTDTRFDYWGREAGNEGWQTEWNSDIDLPTLIRIRIGEGSEPPWPDFIVKPIFQ